MNEIPNVWDIKGKYRMMMIDDLYIEHENNGGRYNIKITTKETEGDAEKDAVDAKRGIKRGDEFNRLIRTSVPQFIDRVHIKLIQRDDPTIPEYMSNLSYLMTLQVSAEEEDIDCLQRLCQLIEDAYGKWLSEMNC